MLSFFTKKRCPACNSDVKKFLPLAPYYLERYATYGFKYINDSETAALSTYECPSCGASDRERLYAEFLQDHLNVKEKIKIIHFAPERVLASFLKKKKNIEYTSIDLSMPGVDVHGDITNLSVFEDNLFDVFVCSHVIEHVKEDSKALSELYRILKPGGWGILMTPICLAIDNSVEDESYNTDELRWKYYGQNDHVRLYSKKDFLKKIKDAHFRVEEHDIKNFGKKKYYALGLKDTSVLYIVKKT